MRKFITSLGLAALVASVAGAQTVSPYASLGFDDGSAENSWKIGNPSGAGGFFNVDFDAVYAGAFVIGLNAVTNETGAGGAISKIGLYPDNLTVDPAGNTPDLANPLGELVNPTGLAGSGCLGGDVAYDIPDLTLGTTNVHVGFYQVTGDSVLWLCSDSSGTIAGRSYFTNNSYSAPAFPFTTANWMLRLAVPEGPAGTFLVDGSTANTSYTEGDPAGLTLSFWGNAGVPGEVLIMGAFVPSFVKITNGLTGSFPPNAADNVFAVSGSVPCTPDIIRVDFRVDLGAFWGDTVDIKPNGKPRAKASNRVSVTFLNNAACGSQPDCFGLLDDQIVDRFVWKVGNPSTSLDWFNVDHGMPISTTDPGTTVNTFTAIEMGSWDFCGSTQSWASVGIYPDSTVFPGTGTPDINNPFTSVGGASATIAPNSGSSYPATVYDIPDYTGVTTSTIYNAAAQFRNGDTCLWLGSDTDGTDDDATDDCATLPSSTSFFTSSGYSTAANPSTTTNWLIKIHWK